MPSVYLLRHCEYANPLGIQPGRLPVELSEEGKEQARKLQLYFAGKNITRIYSSAVLRCKQTSEMISGGVIPILYDKRILETHSAYQGYWAENRHRDGFHFYTHREELGGEGLVDLQRRMASFWDEIVPALSENIVVCSHGDPLMALYAYVYELPLPDEDTEEEDIPGWLQKGEFLEVVLENGRRKEVRQ